MPPTLHHLNGALEFRAVATYNRRVEPAVTNETLIGLSTGTEALPIGERASPVSQSSTIRRVGRRIGSGTDFAHE